MRRTRTSPRRRLRWHVAGFVVALLPLHAATANDVAIAAGRAIVADGVAPGRPGCAACHMLDGSGQPDVGIPRLAGLTASYLLDQLNYFASGIRQNAAMGPYAGLLTPAQRQQVADYFASLPVPPAPEPPDSRTAQVSRGRTVFLNGDDRTNLLACAQCHGPTALGVGDFSPRLAGQAGSYIAEQLTHWRAGGLRDPKGAFMRSEAGHLTPADIKAVAAYLASSQDTETKP
jgi:cytochrome c553